MPDQSTPTQQAEVLREILLTCKSMEKVQEKHGEILSDHGEDLAKLTERSEAQGRRLSRFEDRTREDIRYVAARKGGAAGGLWGSIGGLLAGGAAWVADHLLK